MPFERKDRPSLVILIIGLGIISIGVVIDGIIIPADLSEYISLLRESQFIRDISFITIILQFVGIVILSIGALLYFTSDSRVPDSQDSE